MHAHLTFTCLNFHSSIEFPFPKFVDCGVNFKFIRNGGTSSPSKKFVSSFEFVVNWHGY